jgi:hypothetical protein
MPLREQERRLLRVLERGPEWTLFRTQAREPLRQQERRLLRHEDRVKLRAQVQHQEGTLFRLDERAQVRGPVIGLERWLLQMQERLLLPALLRRLLRVPEQSPHKGQALVRASPP